MIFGFAGRRRSESEPSSSAPRKPPIFPAGYSAAETRPFIGPNKKDKNMTKTNSAARRLELEFFETTRWRVRIQVKTKDRSAAYRKAALMGASLGIQSAVSLRAIGWRNPGSHRRIRFARFLASPAHGVGTGALT